MSIRVRLQSGNLDGIRPLPRVDAPPPPPPRAAAPTAPLKPESANTGSRLSLGTVPQSSQEKAEKLKGVAEDLERQAGAESGGEDAGGQAQEGQPGLITTAQQGLEQGAMSRRLARFGADLVRAVPVVEQGLEAVSGAVDRMAQAPGAVGRVGKVLQGADNLGEVIEKADFGVLATAAATDVRDQVNGIGKALQEGNQAEAVAQSRELARNSVDVKEGISLAREVAAAAPEAIQKVAAPVARAAAPVSRAAAPLTRAAGTVARAGTQAVRATGTTVRAVSTRVARSAAGRVLGKAAGRFLPGVNVAIAAADTYAAVKTVRDPKASAWSKSKALVTAGGSLLAATNIPGVSQAGAAISILSSLAPDKRPRWLGGK